METKEINQENITILAKLGVDAKDIANVYLNITERGVDIPKDVYINNLTEMLKFFQARNHQIEDTESEAIYKEDVLEMIKKNKNLVGLDIDKKIKPVCEKFDSYYFMNPGYTNKLIKKNPQIFNVSNVDLEVYATVLPNFAIKVDGQMINLFEYVIKQDSDFLKNDVQKIYGRIMNLKGTKNSNLFTKEELIQIENGNGVNDEELKEKYTLPSYNGESIADYKQAILQQIDN